MNNQILCPHCGKRVEITEALKKQIEQDIGKSLSKKHEKEIQDLREKIQEEAKRKIASEYSDRQKELVQELKEKDERLSKFREQELELRKEKRAIEEQKKEMALEIEKKIDEERKKVEEQALKQAAEEHHLNDLKKDKVIDDLKKALEEARRKANQGSQQTQGEVLELEIEKLLKKEFPDDHIDEIKKGQRGADVVQRVIDKKGRTCGSILWETKNAKWSNTWFAKLREDKRAAKAELAVLVSVDLPDDIESFTYREGVWIASPQFVVNLALALRFDLIHIHNEKLLNKGKDEKKEILFQYLTSTEFRHRIEAIVEAFNNLQAEVEREKRWFATKWARQEKEIRKIVDNTHGLYGELQAATGRSLQHIKHLELESGDDAPLLKDIS